MDIEADLAEICQPMVPSAFDLSSLEKILTTSLLLKQKGFIWTLLQQKIWQFQYANQKYVVTFDPKIFEKDSSLRLMLPRDSIFRDILNSPNF